MRLRSRIARWKAVARTNRINTEIEDELAFPIDSCAEDFMRMGVPEHESVVERSSHWRGLTNGLGRQRR